MQIWSLSSCETQERAGHALTVLSGDSICDAKEFFSISGVFMSSLLDCEFFERENLVCSFIITRLLLLFCLIINTICACQRSKKAENADKQKNVNASNRCPLTHPEVAAVNSVLLSFQILDLQIQTHIRM